MPQLYPAVDAPAGGSYPATLARNGDPTLLYIGAEFCPICAAERWPMIIALSRFGSFTNLQETHSALDDGDIPTWSFYGSTYTSRYLNFEPYEVETNTNQALEQPPPSVVPLWTGFFQGTEAFPFIDFNQKLVLASSQFPYISLEGRSFADILRSIGSNDNTIGEEVDASAAAFTKYLCIMTGNQPANVCAAVSSVPAKVSAAGPAVGPVPPA